ncbi:MAG: hypothetical protein IJA61_03070 [Clostridia bacterium]|nr:hypothetical protein [Clostridia bacterium]
MSFLSDIKKCNDYKSKRGMEYKGPNRLSVKRRAEVFELLGKIIDNTERYRSDALCCLDYNVNLYRREKDVMNDTYKRLLEEKLCKIVDENPEIKYCLFDNYSEDRRSSEKISFGHYAINCAFDYLAIKIAEDDFAIRMTDSSAYPFPHQAVDKQRSLVVSKILESPVIHEIKDEFGSNIGHYMAKDSRFATNCFIAAKNEKLRTALTPEGETMGLICARCYKGGASETPVSIFVNYPDQREVVDPDGNNMLINMAKAGNDELSSFVRNFADTISVDMANRVNDNGESFVNLINRRNVLLKNADKYIPVELPESLIQDGRQVLRNQIDKIFDKEA